MLKDERGSHDSSKDEQGDPLPGFRRAGLRLRQAPAAEAPSRLVRRSSSAEDVVHRSSHALRLAELSAHHAVRARLITMRWTSLVPS